jgi:T5orf172 domain
MAAGHIYILVNAAMHGYLKIGLTTRTPDERARELSQGTSVVVPYSVAYSESVINCDVAERLIHTRLEKFRVNRGREFFHLPLRDAIRELSSIADMVGRSEMIATDPTFAQSMEEEILIPGTTFYTF